MRSFFVNISFLIMIALRASAQSSPTPSPGLTTGNSVKTGDSTGASSTLQDFQTASDQLQLLEGNAGNLRDGQDGKDGCATLTPVTFDGVGGNLGFACSKFYTDLIKDMAGAKSAIQIMSTACLENTSLPIQEMAQAVSAVNTQPNYMYGESLTSICKNTGNIFDKLKELAGGYEALCGGVAATQLSRLHTLAASASSHSADCVHALKVAEAYAADTQNPYDTSAKLVKDVQFKRAAIFGSIKTEGGYGQTCAGDAAYVSTVIKEAAAKAKKTQPY